MNSSDLKRLADSVINAEGIANSDRDAIVKILTTLANSCKDEPCDDEQEIHIEATRTHGVFVSKKYADWQRNERLKAEIGLKAAAYNNNRLRAENAELRKDAEWQSIETAPRDGTHILVTMAGKKGFGMNKDWCDVAHYFPDPDYPGFYASLTFTEQKFPFMELTHWKRLHNAIDPQKQGSV